MKARPRMGRRALSVLVVVSMFTIGFTILDSHDRALDEQFTMFIPRQIGAHIEGFDGYPLTNYINLWVRVNGSDVGFPYPYANQPPSLGMDFFGTTDIVTGIGGTTWGYTENQLKNESLFPAGTTLTINLGDTTAAAATTVASMARNNSKIVAGMIDDFQVSLQSPANMTAVYNAIHQFDVELGREIDLYLVVYNTNYRDQTPNSWADIEDYFDGISFWCVSNTYASKYPQFAGYEDAIREFHSWLPGKHWWLGIYLYHYNAGAYPADYSYEWMAIATRMIQANLISKLSILENFWILNELPTAYLTRNFLSSEFLPNYQTVITGSGYTTTAGNIENPYAIRDFSVLNGGYSFHSIHAQNVTIGGSWSDGIAQNMRTGETWPLLPTTGGDYFWADPGDSYRIWHNGMSDETYNTRQYLTTATWENVNVTMNNVLNIGTSLTIKNSTIHFGYDGRDSLKNSTTPGYGIILNASAKLTIINSTIEPTHRMFPFYFNTTAALTTGTLTISNSTIACIAGDLRIILYSYINDSRFYCFDPDGSDPYGLRFNGASGTPTLRFNRNVVWNYGTPAVEGFQFVPGNSYTAGRLTMRDNLFAGGYHVISVDMSSSQRVDFENCSIAMTSNTGQIPIYLSNGLATKPFNITQRFSLNSVIESFGGQLRDATNKIIGNYTTTNGTIMTNVIQQLSYTTSLSYINKYPWTFTVTSGLTTGYAYAVGMMPTHRIINSTGWSDYGLTSFNSSTYSINTGQSWGSRLLRINGSYLNQDNWFTSNWSMSIRNAYAAAKMNYTLPSETGIRANISSGSVILNPSLWNPEEITNGHTIASWNATPSDPSANIGYAIGNLDFGTNYKIFENDSLQGEADGPTVSFIDTGIHGYDLITGYDSQTSSLISLGVTLVLLGIIVSIVVSDVKMLNNPRMSPQAKMRQIVKSVIFIVIGLVMWGLLYSIAYG